MRVISQSELLRLSRAELSVLLHRIVCELPYLPENSPELRVAHFNLQCIRAALTRAVRLIVHPNAYMILSMVSYLRPWVQGLMVSYLRPWVQGLRSDPARLMHLLSEPDCRGENKAVRRRPRHCPSGQVPPCGVDA
jgi:hypothetical protein